MAADQLKNKILILLTFIAFIVCMSAKAAEQKTSSEIATLSVTILSSSDNLMGKIGLASEPPVVCRSDHAYKDNCLVTLISGQNTNKGTVIITNISSVTAKQINVTLPSDWSNVSTTRSGCDSVVPRGECRFDFIATANSATHPKTAIPIQGSNTNKVFFDMVVVNPTGTLTAVPQSLQLISTASPGIVTVTNTSAQRVNGINVSGGGAVTVSNISTCPNNNLEPNATCTFVFKPNFVTVSSSATATITATSTLSSNPTVSINISPQFAYVADSLGNMYQCSFKSDGTFNTCNTTPASPPAGWTPNGITFGIVNGTRYGYVSDNPHQHVFRCLLNANNAFSSCSNAIAPGSTEPFWVPNGVAFATTNGTQYAYVADSLSQIFKCNLNSSGQFTTCSGIKPVGITWSPDNITFKTVSGTQYGYVADGLGNVYRCTISSNGAFAACNKTPIVAPAWVPNGITFATVDVAHAYVADNSGAMYECGLNADGSFNTCVLTPVAAPAWTPFASAFAKANFLQNQIAYVADSSGRVFDCSLNTNGTFQTCSPTPSVAPAWQPKGIAMLQ